MTRKSELLLLVAICGTLANGQQKAPAGNNATNKIEIKDGDCLEILKSEPYNLSDKRAIPICTYQSSDFSKLVELRRVCSLDSIVGTGNEVSQILNLMHWIHNTIPHDGAVQNPEEKNALSMITICKREHRAMNCRGLAIALNECYLAMGFKSRYVACLPKDTTDRDSHVLTMVYSNALKKWLWIDPTSDAYVMNEKGELLSIEEVREHLIHGYALIVNPDANRNHKITDSKEEYLYKYMAKNLYRLQSPVNSLCDYETKAQGKTISFVELSPINISDQRTEKAEDNLTTIKLASYNMTILIYKTNNPSIFWQPPN